MSTPTLKTRPRFPIVGGRDSYADAIKETQRLADTINTRKGFRKPTKSDSTTTEQPSEEDAGKPGRISGSDSAEETTPTPAPPSVPESDEEQVTLPRSALSTLIDRKVEAVAAGLKKQLDALSKERDEAKAAVEREQDKAEQLEKDYQDKLEAEKKRSANLANVFADFGTVAPVDFSENDGSGSYITPQKTRGGISPRDALKEYGNRLDQSLRAGQTVISRESGLQYQQRDSRDVDRFFRQHRDSLRAAMNDIAAKAGIFSQRAGKDAPTTFENFPVLFKEYLSQVVRTEHSASFCLWQFVNKAIRAGVPINQTTDVPRVKHLAQGTQSSDWLLTPATEITGSQNLFGGNIPVRIREYGMGGVNVPPVVLTELVSQTDILDLEKIVRERIGYNYELFQELSILELLLTTTKIVYPAGSTPVVEADVSVGDGAQLSLNFLGSLSAQMAQVPKMADGSLIFVANKSGMAQLEADIESRTRYIDRANVEDLANMLQSKTGQDYSGMIKGYKFHARGFAIFDDSFIGAGLPGSPGVQTKTLGGTPTTVRSSFAFGVDALGWAESMPMEIRTDPNTNYGRLQKLIWKAHLGFTGLDIDPDRTILATEEAREPNAEEQLRVWEVRTSDIPI